MMPDPTKYGAVRVSPDPSQYGAVPMDVQKRNIQAEIENDPISQEAREAQSYTPAELIAGSSPVRFALGAASPILGAAQLVAEALGDTTGTETLAELENLKQRGMKAYGTEGADMAGIAGTVLSPVFAKAAKLFSPGTSVATKVGQGVVTGGAAGATAPVTEEDGYWETKAGQTLFGVVTGGAVPAAVASIKGVVKGARNISDMFTQKGAGNILTRYQKRVIGDENVPEVVKVLRETEELVPGVNPTAAEALATTPAGSPILAHQKITASTPGGVSAQFGNRKMQQMAAREAAEAARHEATKELREEALKQANKGGVRGNEIIAKIDKMLSEPGYRSSKVVNKTLSAAKEQIAEFTNKKGVIDAKDLYTIRKEIGNTIKEFSMATKNWDKKLTGGLERSIQKHMDDAIEAAGGKSWKEYLAEFTRRSRALDADKLRRLMSQRPAQRTELGGGVNVAEETRVAMPQLLSRPMMATNFILKKLGMGVEKRLDPEAARRYLDPQKLADALEPLPSLVRLKVAKELMQLGYLPALAGGISSVAKQ